MTPHPQRCPIRPEVLAFAMRMEMALRKRDKERGDSYKESDSEFLVNRLHEEVTELEEAVEQFDDTPWPQKSYLLSDIVDKVLSEGADVGNFAMMTSYVAYPSDKTVTDYINAWDLPCASHSSAPTEQEIRDKVLDEVVRIVKEWRSDYWNEQISIGWFKAKINELRTAPEQL